jgi:hypothetical protein
MGQAAAGATGAAASTGGGLAGAASAAMPWVSLGLGAANIGMSLVEASKQKELKRSADREVEKASAEQERLLSQDFYEKMQVPMGVYDKEFAANTAAQQQALSALTEGDPRLLLGAVGKVQGATVDANANAADRAAEKLYNLGLTQAGASERTANKLAALEGQRLAGAQEASAAAQMAKLQAQQKAIGAGGDLIKGLGALIPEYSKTDINANNTDMSTVLNPAAMATTGLNAASQLQSNNANALNPLYQQYSWGSLANPSAASQLLGSTSNVLSGFRMPG